MLKIDVNRLAADLAVIIPDPALGPVKAVGRKIRRLAPDPHDRLLWCLRIATAAVDRKIIDTSREADAARMVVHLPLVTALARASGCSKVFARFWFALGSDLEDRAAEKGTGIRGVIPDFIEDLGGRIPREEKPS